MRHLLTTALVSTSLATASFAAPLSAPSQGASFFASELTAQDAQIWLAKDDKGKKDKKDKKKHKKKDKKKHKDAKHKDPKKKKSKDEKHVEKALKKASKNYKKVKIDRDSDEYRVRIDDVLKAKAPEGRDMALLAGAAALGFLGRDVLITDVEPDQLVTYRNCPPGLAKMDPPCVPPGLAKKGVTYEEWVAYDEDKIDGVWHDQRETYLQDREVRELEDVDTLLLTSEQIATLFNISPAPQGQRYGLIDGMPVLLEEKDYDSLLLINELAGVSDLEPGLTVAPTAALTQEELRRLYRLPEPATGHNYAVLNGQLITLEDSAYETLQMIRVARAFL